MMNTNQLLALALASTTAEGLAVLGDYTEEHGHPMARAIGAWVELVARRTTLWMRSGAADHPRPLWAHVDLLMQTTFRGVLPREEDVLADEVPANALALARVLADHWTLRDRDAWLETCERLERDDH